MGLEKLERSIYEICNEPGEEFISLDDKYKVYVAIWSEGNTIFFCFKETDSVINWIRNLTFWKKPYKNMDTKFYAHRGFVADYKLVRDKIHEKYIEFSKDKESTSVVVSGHSRGGALAILCHEDFFWHYENKSYNIKSLKGFSTGAPRVFSDIKNRSEIKRRLSNFVRLENGNDLVAKVPLALMLFFKENKPIRIGRRLPFFGSLLPSAIYHHHHYSYHGHTSNKNYRDNRKTNPVFIGAIVFYSLVYLIAVGAISWIIIL